MTEHVRQLLHVVIALGMLATIALGTCPHTAADRGDGAGRRANAVDLAHPKPTRRPRG
ncbi:hypothetical protein Slala03_65470 [Streptomyces lavendulae subsp. lavendulae]|uniref:hypothetical protein n=1 Tax=Streptomyces lavendulae TaxID=1914 RepID=UPI0024A21443|nr:hypothetical protein [Streptomyces lavendulae]GLV86858.1 hypothetical protein Slala03_65470 [Streptomyces lavendulae subsp. lavendulae]